jgi:hypothetical protein
MNICYLVNQVRKFVNWQVRPTIRKTGYLVTQVRRLT